MIDWTEEAPTEPGFYWFYGDPRYGSMGKDYMEEHVNTESIGPSVVLVEVFKISNGLMAKSEGTFVSLKKFELEKKCEGYLGFWKVCDIPVPPVEAFEKMCDVLYNQMLDN